VLHHRATKNTNCKQKTCRNTDIAARLPRHDTAMYPMAKEYTLMQPFENVMRRCNPLQYGIKSRLLPHRRAAQVTLSTFERMERALFSTFKQRKAVAA
jgi:hypothetical protein